MATEIGFPPSPLFKIAREEGEGVLVSRIRPVRNYGLGEMHSLGEWHDSVGAYSKKNGVSDEDENITSYICTLKEADTNCNTLLRGELSVGMLRPKEL